MDASRFQYLMEQYKSGRLSATEQDELLRFAAEGNGDDWEGFLSPWMNETAGEKEELAPELITRELVSVLSADKGLPALPRVHRIHFIRRWGWAAAILAGVLIAGMYYFIDRTQESPAGKVAQIRDILPGSSKATLTLADGSSIGLDSTGNQLIQQGVATVHQQNGRLQYEVKETGLSVSYNTLSTPRQGQFQLLLSDGTKVWLNAASSIRYPTAFSGKERKVEVTGEVYFEVAGNAHQPFIVSVNKTEIQVLGTVFNINAYPDENKLCATLVSGLIKVNTPRESITLQPGKTAAVLPDGSAKVSNANIKIVTAWKNGSFGFEDADIQTVFRQLARWYNIEVEFRGAVPKTTFSGEIERSLTLSQVLQGLSAGDIHYTLENGNKLIIQP